MVRKRVAAVDCNQLFLFEEDRPSPPPQVQVQATTSYDQIIAEDAAIRRNFKSLEEYYPSPQWKFKKKQKLDKVGRKCEQCGRPGRVEVHHLNYDSLYDERMEDLQVVCLSCHPAADHKRERNSAYTSFLRTKYGDDAGMIDPQTGLEEFDDWYDSLDDY